MPQFSPNQVVIPAKSLFPGFLAYLERHLQGNLLHHRQSSDGGFQELEPFYDAVDEVTFLLWDRLRSSPGSAVFFTPIQYQFNFLFLIFKTRKGLGAVRRNMVELCIYSKVRLEQCLGARPKE